MNANYRLHFHHMVNEEHGERWVWGCRVIVVTPIEPYSRLRPFLSVNG